LLIIQKTDNLINKSKKVDKTIKRDIKAHYNAKTGKMKLQIE